MLFHDGMVPKLVKTGRVLVDTVKRPTQNLCTLTEGAISRMAGGMRSFFDKND